MKYINRLLTVGLFGIALISCDAEKRDQDVSPVGSLENKPTASVSTDVSGGTIEEGTSITFTVTQDKPTNFGVTYKATVTGDVDEDDYEVGSLTIPAYSTEGTMTLTFFDDMFPEESENVEVHITVAAVDSASLLANGDLDVAYNYTLTNVNSTEALTVGLKWNEDQAVDIDMSLLDANGDELAYQATGDYPEINEFIPNSAPNGIYYISIQPYEVVTPQWEYTFGISEPNGEVTTFTGVFDGENLDAYTADMSPTLGEVYRLVKIVKNGTDYTLTQLP
ncbi:MAG TPA: hypothetical protein VFM82_12520 [Flavobacteriaceae bacterium]|nr:hypothetical protein [Flavobacteriaceae bacterium]